MSSASKKNPNNIAPPTVGATFYLPLQHNFNDKASTRACPLNADGCLVTNQGPMNPSKVCNHVSKGAIDVLCVFRKTDGTNGTFVLTPQTAAGFSKRALDPFHNAISDHEQRRRIEAGGDDVSETLKDALIQSHFSTKKTRRMVFQAHAQNNKQVEKAKITLKQRIDQHDVTFSVLKGEFDMFKAQSEEKIEVLVFERDQAIAGRTLINNQIINLNFEKAMLVAECKNLTEHQDELDTLLRELVQENKDLKTELSNTRSAVAVESGNTDDVSQLDAELEDGEVPE